MFTLYAESTRRAVSAVAAIAIVSFSAVALDQAHIASAPRGTVEVGELTLVDAKPIAAVTLPEVVVVAKRVAYLVARSGTRDQTRSATVNGSVEGALLK